VRELVAHALYRNDGSCVRGMGGGRVQRLATTSVRSTADDCVSRTLDDGDRRDLASRPVASRSADAERSRRARDRSLGEAVRRRDWWTAPVSAAPSMGVSPASSTSSTSSSWRASQVWCANYRPEALRLLVATNPHAPPHFRVNAPLSNLPQFASAFACEQGDAMVRPEEQRCAVW